MPDVGTQLREYFDETVERMTEEDIRIRATTARGVPVRGPRLRVRPVAAVSVSFGLALTLIGGVMVANKFLGGEQGDAAGTGLPGASTAVESGSPWILLWLMAGFGLVAFGMWSMRRSSDDVRERGDETMQTIERPEGAAPPGDTKLKSRNRMLTWLVGILAVAVIGLGAWLIAGNSGDEAATLPAAAQDAIDDYYQAWNTLDQEAFLEATSSSFRFVSGFGVWTAEEQATRLRVVTDFAVTVHEQVVSGDGPYYVAQRETLRNQNKDYEGVSTLRIQEDLGEWRVSLHQWNGQL